MAHDFSPVVALVPRDFAGGVDFDGHDLADTSALDEDDRCADSSSFAAALLAALDVCSDEGVPAGDVGALNNVSSCNSKPVERK